MVEFSVLGTTGLRGSSGDEVLSVLAQPKRMALLCYLALADPGGFQRRDKLLDVFWPRHDEKKARSCLSVSIHYLKRALGPDVIVTRGKDEIGVAQGAFWCDAIEFMAAVREDDLLRAADLYSGPLLDAFHVDGASEFDRWMVDVRERMCRMALSTLGRLADEAAAAGDDAARVWARRALELAPYDDDAVCRLVALLARSGHRAEALHVFESFAERLESDLELEPSSEAQHLVARIRAGKELGKPRAVPAGKRAADDPVGDVRSAPRASSRVDGARRWSRFGPAAAVGVPIVVLSVVGSLVFGRGAGRSNTGAPPGTQVGDRSPTVLRATTATERGRLIVIPLEPLSDDEELNVLAQMAADEIGRAIDLAGTIDVIPAVTVREAARRLGANATTTDFARATTATHAVAGTVARIDGQVRFVIEILDLRAGDLVRALDPVSGPVDSSEVTVGRLSQLAAAAVAVLLDPEAPDRIRGASTPPSIDVFRDYLRQGELFVQGDFEGAIAMGESISARAPDYVPALLETYSAHANLGRGHEREMDSLRALLMPLRERMTRGDRLLTEYQSAAFVGDPERTTRAAEDLYRLDSKGGGYAAGRTAVVTGRLEDAVERFLAYDVQSDERGRKLFFWRDYLSLTYHRLGRYEEELALARADFANFPGDRRLHGIEARALVALGRLNEADSIVRHMTELPPQQEQAPFMAEVWVAVEMRVHGYEEESNAAFENIIPRTSALGLGHQYDRGRAYYYAKRWEDADTVFASVHASTPDDIDRMASYGVILAKLGRREEALRVSDRLGQKTRSYMRGVNFGGQARIAAALGERDEAVRLTQLAFGDSWDVRLRLHQDPAFEDVWGYPPWEVLVAPH